MTRVVAAGLSLLLAAAIHAQPAAADTGGRWTGIWGVAETVGGAPNCKAYVMVLRADPEGEGRTGGYQKAILDLGTTQGPRDTIVGTASWTASGDRLTVTPSLSLSRLEPEQRFLLDRASATLIREAPDRLLFRRCPDRDLRPMTR